VDRFVGVEIRHQPPAGGEDLGEDVLLAVGISASIGPLVLVTGCGPQDEVTPEGLLHQDALAVGAGAREEDVVAKVALILAQEHVLAQPRLDLEGRGESNIAY